MSWSVSTPDACVAPDALEDIDRLEIPSGSQQDTPEGQAQLAAAKVAAKSLIESGAMGEPTTTKFSTTLNGHANAEHVATEGWVNDCITVSVRQVTP